MTRDQIRNILDSLGLATRVDEEGDLCFILGADDDFGHSVSIWLILSPDGNRLSFVGVAPDYKPAGDLLYMANRSNGRRNYPTAVVRGGHVRFEYSIYIKEEVSEEYLVNCIRSICSSMWTAFCDLEKDNIEE